MFTPHTNAMGRLMDLVATIQIGSGEFLMFFLENKKLSLVMDLVVLYDEVKFSTGKTLVTSRLNRIDLLKGFGNKSTRC